MIIVLSPAKSLDFESTVPTSKHTQPLFGGESAQLVDELRGYSPKELSALMGISDKLGELNAQRYADWQRPFDRGNARQALFAFTGDVYAGLDVGSFTRDDLEYAQQHLRVLSGLYGILRPLDLMQPYRLEMGTRLPVSDNADLYEFWNGKITEQLNRDLEKHKHPVLINLASNEYFKSVKKKELNAGVVSPVFKDYKNGQYKIISFFAKKARGMMAAWIIRNRVDSPDRLKEFDGGGYRYSAKDSTEAKPVFLRKQD